MDKPEHKTVEPTEHRIAREIFNEIIVEKHQNAVNVFDKEGRKVVLQMEDIFQLICESVCEAKYGR